MEGSDKKTKQNSHSGEKKPKEENSQGKKNIVISSSFNISEGLGIYWNGNYTRLTKKSI